MRESVAEEGMAWEYPILWFEAFLDRSCFGLSSFLVKELHPKKISHYFLRVTLAVEDTKSIFRSQVPVLSPF
jgi:hypothetical protein